MADRYFKDEVMTLEKEIRQLHSTVVFGASGAVTSDSQKGFVVTKVAGKSGRYLITLGTAANPDTYYEFKNLIAIVEGPTDAAVADGFLPIVRNVDTTNGCSTVEVQLVSAAGADDDPTSGIKLHLTVFVKNSSVDF